MEPTNSIQCQSGSRRYRIGLLNSLMELTRAGGAIGIPGLYVTGDPGGVDASVKIGNLGIRIGLGWAKSHSFHTGQCPVLRYNRQLMQAILHDKVYIPDACNVTIISLVTANGCPSHLIVTRQMSGLEIAIVKRNCCRSTPMRLHRFFLAAE
jgi:threonine dehydrogenase-like Zn-dependent dehydrogenase